MIMLVCWVGHARKRRQAPLQSGTPRLLAVLVSNDTKHTSEVLHVKTATLTEQAETPDGHLKLPH
jgi:hypothetical protein